MKDGDSEVPRLVFYYNGLEVSLMAAIKNMMKPPRQDVMKSAAVLWKTQRAAGMYIDINIYIKSRLNKAGGTNSRCNIPIKSFRNDSHLVPTQEAALVFAQSFPRRA